MQDYSVLSMLLGRSLGQSGDYKISPFCSLQLVSNMCGDVCHCVTILFYNKLSPLMILV